MYAFPGFYRKLMIDPPIDCARHVSRPPRSKRINWNWAMTRGGTGTRVSAPAPGGHEGQSREILGDTKMFRARAYAMVQQADNR